MKSKPHMIGLWILFSLFCFRVLAQLLQKLYPVSFLPPFEEWHSGTFPYSVLVGFQVVIIIFALIENLKVSLFDIKPDPKKGKRLIIFGSIYLSLMIFRLLGGYMFFTSFHWFTVRIPTIFHIVLALFLILHGHLHIHAHKKQRTP